MERFKKRDEESGGKHPMHDREENERILEENGIKSLQLLRAKTAYLKANIQLLKDHGRNPLEYARASYMQWEPEWFSGFLDKVEEPVIKELREKMPHIPPKDITDLVNRTSLQIFPIKIELLERRRVDLSKFTDIKQFEKFINIPVQKLKMSDLSPFFAYSIAEKEIVIFYGFKGKKHFDKAAMAGLTDNEQEAFREVEKKIQDDGKISRREVEEAIARHTPKYILDNYPDTVKRRTGKILRTLEHDDVLKKWDELVEKQQNG